MARQRRSSTGISGAFLWPRKAATALSGGRLRALLQLESRLVRGAFRTGRLDTVKLIADQLAAGLDNARLHAEFQQMADEQAALRRVAMLVARGAPPEEVFAAVAREVGRVLEADAAYLTRYDPDAGTVIGAWAGTTAIQAVPVGTRLPFAGRTVRTEVFRTGKPARFDDYATASGPTVSRGLVRGIRSAVGVPISVAGRLWGLMSVASARHEPLPADTEARLAGFTELVATAVANTAAREALIISRARIVAAADEARHRIERDLHDGAQQRLVSLVLRLRAARAAVPPQLPELAAKLDSVADDLGGALEELTELARGIHPAILAEHGLGPVLQTLARRSSVPVDLDIRVRQRLPEHVEVSAYYVVAEALTNAAKHAHASAITVGIEVTGDVVCVVVRDDGAGGAGFTGGTGLVGLRDRVEALGGRITLHSPTGAGTSLRAELPLTATNRDISGR